MGRSKWVRKASLYSCVTAKQSQDFDRANYEGPGANVQARPFQSMLDQLIFCIPNRSALAQNKDLSAFTQCASRTTYAELQRVCTSLE
jgi:hypothetical protein